ncbi:PKD domain-containing protein [Cytophagaceae bacterium DM2B3-1]|uniref:PKD domain-containing protein n=1 Tax=Xanthocytophaga flava TaxID=3048013 RepID=A0ABT7CII3_9BACT|nr:PKD domain-containing protein [Xanthocytophaga flavus]MDJ1492862.1 PKD domain-containing protein [Xanthocytophaga flavus]
MNKILHLNLFLLLLVISSFSSYAQVNWPFKDANGNNIRGTVNGTPGEFRTSGGNRFHGGVDLTNGTETAVYAINSGTVTVMAAPSCWNAYIQVGIVQYKHIKPSNFDPVRQVKAKLLQTGDVVNVGDFLGVMYTSPGGCNLHVHINDNPANGHTNYINRQLSPFTDLVAPLFYDRNGFNQTEGTVLTANSPNAVEFRANGHNRTHDAALLNTTTTVNTRTYRILYNRVDMVSKIKDPKIETNGNGTTGRNGPNAISYEILNQNSQSIDGSRVENINFNTIPDNTRAQDVFDSRAECCGTGTRHVYILTSHPHTAPYDRYWNTNLREGTAPLVWNQTQQPNINARVNQEAHYPDGIYTVRVQARDIANYEATTQNVSISHDAPVVIDNYRPYVRTVVAMAGTTEIYRANWVWDATTARLTLNRQDRGFAKTTNSITLTLTFSEPMKSVKVGIPSLGIEAQTAAATTNPAVWTFSVPASTSENKHLLYITGKDYAENELEQNPANIPIRQSATVWSPVPVPGTDINHYFNIGAGCSSNGRIAQQSGARIRSNSNCMITDFIVDKRNPVINTPVTFTDLSSGGDGTPLTYSWNFVQGATPQTSTNAIPGSVVYNSTGSKTVTLEVCDGMGCLTETKTAYINVIANNTTNQPLVVDFSANKQVVKLGEVVTLTSQVTGGKGSLYYNWELGEGASGNDPVSPTPQVSYTTSGNKTISLTVTDENGSVVANKINYIYVAAPNIQPLQANIGGCISRAQVNGLISFSDFSSGGYGPPYNSYLWDFGDGSTSTDQNPTHRYAAMGQYTVTLTVCDGSGCNTKVSPNCVNVNIGSDIINPDFLINGQDFQNGGTPITVGRNTPVTLTSTTSTAIIGALDYSWVFDYYNSTGGSAATPAKSVSQNPQICYTTSGTMSVWLRVGYTNNMANPRVVLKESAIKVVDGLGATGCVANIGQVSLSTTCWKQGGSYPKFNIPITANCPIGKIVITGENGETIVNNELSFSWRSQPPAFPYKQTYKISAYQYDGVKYNLLTQKDVVFTLTETPLANAGPDQQVCYGSNTQIGSDGQVAIFYKWTSSDPSNLSYLSDINSSSPVFSTSVSGTYTYTLTATNPVTGCSSSDDVIIKMGTPLIAQNNTTTMYTGRSLTLGIGISGGTGTYTYSWEPTAYLDDATKAKPIMTAPLTDESIIYYVTVTDVGGCSVVGEVTINVSSTTPSDLKATPLSHSVIQLTWEDHTSDELGFVLERSIGNNSSFVPIITLPANTTSYKELCLNPQTQYYYRISAKKATGNSPYSNEASAITLNGVVKEWDKRFGGIGEDMISAVVPTSDGGYVLAGISDSGVTGNKSSASKGKYDYWIVKTDATGNKQWDKTYGGFDDDHQFSEGQSYQGVYYKCIDIQQTKDGGYIVGGNTFSGVGGDITQASLGGTDYWIVKTDANGTKIWEKRFGSSANDQLYNIGVVDDGGYLLGGSMNGKLTLTKINSTGNVVWQNVYGGLGMNAVINSERFVPLPDGSCFFSSEINTTTHEKIIVKVDATGNIVKSITPSVIFHTYALTNDNGFILVEEEHNWGSSKPDRIILKKIDSDGKFIWQKEHEYFSVSSCKVLQTSDGDYLISFIDVSNTYGIGILKVDASGNKQWNQSFTTTHQIWPKGIQKALDGGYIIGATVTTSDNSLVISEPNIGLHDYWLLKINDKALNSSTSIITEKVSPRVLETGSQILIPFSACGVNTGNVFTAQLSDQFGRFSNPVNIGTLTGNTSGAINATIPLSTIQGTLYRVRVISSNPALVGTDNQEDITIGPACNRTLTASPNVSIALGQSTQLQAFYNNTCDRSLLFDGVDDNVSIGTNSKLAFDRTNTFTVEAWFKAPTLAAAGYVIFSKMKNASPYQGYNIFLWEGKVRIQMISSWPAGIVESTTARFDDNQWHHVAWTYDGSSNASGSRIYVDGVEQTTTVDINNLTGSTIEANTPSIIGSRPGSLFFKGQLDEVRVWSTTRSATEISTNMRTRQQTNATGLVGYWRLDEGSGTTTADLTANALTGTLAGGPSWQSGVPPVLTWSPATGLNTTTGTIVTAKPTQTTTYTVTDGTLTASVTVTISSSGARAQVSEAIPNQIESSFYPNPFIQEGTLFVKDESNQTVDVVIMNLQGQLLYQKSDLPTNTPIIMGTELPVGVGVIRISHPNQPIQYIKIIKIEH